MLSDGVLKHCCGTSEYYILPSFLLGSRRAYGKKSDPCRVLNAVSSDCNMRGMLVSELRPKSLDALDGMILGVGSAMDKAYKNVVSVQTVSAHANICHRVSMCHNFTLSTRRRCLKFSQFQQKVRRQVRGCS